MAVDDGGGGGGDVEVVASAVAVASARAHTPWRTPRVLRAETLCVVCPNCVSNEKNIT